MQKSSFVPAKKVATSAAHIQRTTTGVPTFDCLIGGGLLYRSICVIEEDEFATFSDIFIRTFVASSIANEQDCIYVSLKHGECLLKSLPSPVDVSSQYQDSELNESANDKLNIAWRYENEPVRIDELQSNTKSSQVFDHSKRIELNDNQKSHILEVAASTLDEINASSRASTSCDLIEHRIYGNCLQEIERILTKLRQHSAKQNGPCRIVLRSVGPTWFVRATNTDWEVRQFTLFLLGLRILLRKFEAIALITTDALTNFGVSTLATLSDFVFRFESFESRRSALRAAGLSHIDGLLHVRKLPRYGTLRKPAMETLDVAFSMKNGRQLVVQRVSLPPDLGAEETAMPTSKEVHNEAASQRQASQSEPVRLPSDEEDEVDEDAAIELSSSVRSISLPCASNVVINPRKMQLDF